MANVRHRSDEGAPTGPTVVGEDDSLAQAAYAAAVRLMAHPATTAAANGDPGRGYLYLLGMAGRFDLLEQLDGVARRATQPTGVPDCGGGSTCRPRSAAQRPRSATGIVQEDARSAS